MSCVLDIELIAQQEEAFSDSMCITTESEVFSIPIEGAVVGDDEWALYLDSLPPNRKSPYRSGVRRVATVAAVTSAGK